METKEIYCSESTLHCFESEPGLTTTKTTKDQSKRLINAPTNSLTHCPSRTRKRSWSRSARKPASRLSAEHLTPHIVEGNAHICFSKDKNWFQGNIIEHGKCDISGSIYKISGKMSNTDEQLEDGKITMNDIFQLSNVFDPGNFEEGEKGSSPTTEIPERQISKLNVLKIPKSNGDSSSTSPGSHTLSSLSSGSDYLDSDLIKEAIDRLGIEDPQASPQTCSRSSSISATSAESPAGFDLNADMESNTRKYNIAVTDFETGMTYTMKGICVKRSSASDCTIIGEDDNSHISFKSKKCFKGNSADIIISRHLGPNFVDKNMSVFVGDIRLKYTDPVCKPNNTTISQWCN